MTETAPEQAGAEPRGMTERQARIVRQTIIGLCILSLVFIFQPFSLNLYSIGAGAVVLGGLAFNLVPLCEPGRPLRRVVVAGLIVLAVLIVVVAAAIGSVELYATYLRR